MRILYATNDETLGPKNTPPYFYHLRKRLYGQGSVSLIKFNELATVPTQDTIDKLILDFDNNQDLLAVHRILKNTLPAIEAKGARISAIFAINCDPQTQKTAASCGVSALSPPDLLNLIEALNALDPSTE